MGKKDQIQRTQAGAVSETPRNQSKGKLGAPHGGITADIKFSMKKPRQ